MPKQLFCCIREDEKQFTSKGAKGKGIDDKCGFCVAGAQAFRLRVWSLAGWKPVLLLGGRRP